MLFIIAVFNSCISFVVFKLVILEFFLDNHTKKIVSLISFFAKFILFNYSVSFCMHVCVMQTNDDDSLNFLIPGFNLNASNVSHLEWS